MTTPRLFLVHRPRLLLPVVAMGARNALSVLEWTDTPEMSCVPVGELEGLLGEAGNVPVYSRSAAPFCTWPHDLCAGDVLARLRDRRRPR